MENSEEFYVHIFCYKFSLPLVSRTLLKLELHRLIDLEIKKTRSEEELADIRMGGSGFKNLDGRSLKIRSKSLTKYNVSRPHRFSKKCK